MKPVCVNCPGADHWGEDCPKKEKAIKRAADEIVKETWGSVTKKSVTKRKGRPRLFKSNAERQKAYRKRKTK